MGYRFFVLRRDEAPSYAALTYPAYRPLLGRIGPSGFEHVAVAAASDEGSAGLALAKIARDSGRAELLSAFVAADHRRLGVGTGLLRCLEEHLGTRRCGTIQASYGSDRPSTEAVEGLLSKCGFPIPGGLRALVGHCRSDRLKEAPWVRRRVLPSAFQIFSWGDLSDAELGELRTRRGTAAIPDELAPWRTTDPLEPLNSVGLRYRGEIVGWQICHRPLPDTIRYSHLWVREDLQRLGLAAALVAEAAARHLEAGTPGHATFIVYVNFPPMLRFVNRHLAPYLDELRETRQTYKLLTLEAHS